MNFLLRLNEERDCTYCPDGSRAGPSGRCVSLHWRAEARPVKITCPNCGNRARWPECPHCGYPLISRRREIASWCAFILAVAVIVVLMLRAALRCERGDDVRDGATDSCANGHI